MRTDDVRSLQRHWAPFCHMNGRPRGVLASYAGFQPDLPRIASSRAASSGTASPEDGSGRYRSAQSFAFLRLFIAATVSVRSRFRARPMTRLPREACLGRTQGSGGEPTKLTEPTAPLGVKILETPSDRADKTDETFAGTVLSVLSVGCPGAFAISRSWFSHFPIRISPPPSGPGSRRKRLMAGHRTHGRPPEPHGSGWCRSGCRRPTPQRPGRPAKPSLCAEYHAG